MQTQKMSDTKIQENSTEQPSLGHVFKIQKSKVVSNLEQKPIFNQPCNKLSQNDSNAKPPREGSLMSKLFPKKETVI